MTDHVAGMMKYISSLMDMALGESDTTGFAARTVEPSAGDIFDLHTDVDTVERYAYLANDRIVPLYRMKNGDYVHYHGTPPKWIEVVTWDEIINSMEYADYSDVYLEVVSDKSSDSMGSLDQAINKITEWSENNLDYKYRLIVRGLVAKLRGL